MKRPSVVLGADDTPLSDRDRATARIADERYSLAVLRRPGVPLRLAAIAAVLAAASACFAWAGGWLSPGLIDQARIIDTFQDVDGVYPGFRRNHAKGVCLTGYFDSSGAGASHSKAGVFKAGRVPVFGRFSLAGGLPMVADSPTALLALGLDFALPDGEAWRTATVALPVFPFKDPRAFYEQLAAQRPDPKTGKPDPALMQAFLAAHPETVHATAAIKAQKHASGFADTTFNGLNAFMLVDDAGQSTPVRWSMVPVDAAAASPATPPTDHNYLFDDLLARLQRGPVQWHLVLTLGEAGDVTDDATIAWPAGRQRLDAGTLTVTGLQGEAAGNCRDINFDPLVLPSGIAPSDDPLLSARSAAYSVSFTRRAGEAKTPSAVQIGKGP